MNRPTQNEYAPSYQKYLDLVDGGDFIKLLDDNTRLAIDFFKSINPEQENFRYAENKWTMKEVLVHIIDIERGFSYRALVCARRDDRIPLYGLDEDHYVKNVNVTDRTINNLIEEFVAVRNAFRFIYTYPNSDYCFLGNGTDHKISARAIGFIAIGHVTHHINVLREKYLQQELRT